MMGPRCIVDDPQLNWGGCADLDLGSDGHRSRYDMEFLTHYTNHNVRRDEDYVYVFSNA
jgi:hypothetical protein